jgi:spore coat protein H
MGSFGKNSTSLFFLLTLFCTSHSYPPETTSDSELSLTDTTRIIENRIEFYLSNAVYRKIEFTDGRKVNLGKPPAWINGDTVEVKKLKTRGKSTLYLRRKSFTIHLKDKVGLKYNGNEEKFKKFYAISLCMDRNYIRNRLAFGMMRELGLFELFFSYGELRINGQSEGIYLFVERPEDWAIKMRDSPLVIRRGFGHNVDKLKTAKDTDNAVRRKYKRNFKQIYRILNKYDGEMLYNQLSEWIDLELYMKWLAFNFLIRNGDYTDEVYLYIEPGEDRFKIIPWDYDDIFARQPHEGMEQVHRALKKKHIFSSEDQLDRRIALDPYLYEKYLHQLNDVLKLLTPGLIKNIFEETYAEVYPYYLNEDIIHMSVYDAFKNANLGNLAFDLCNTYETLLLTWSNVTKELMDIRKK